MPGTLAGPGIGVACYQWALSTHSSALVLSIVALSPLFALLFCLGLYDAVFFYIIAFPIHERTMPENIS